MNSLKAAEFKAWLREEKGKVSWNINAGQTMMGRKLICVVSEQYLDDLSGDKSRKSVSSPSLLYSDSTICVCIHELTSSSILD